MTRTERIEAANQQLQEAAEKALEILAPKSAPAASEPIGRGQICSAGLWIIDPHKDCPVCGSPAFGFAGCLRDPELAARVALKAAGCE